MNGLIRSGMLLGVVVALVCLSGVLVADPGNGGGAIVLKDVWTCSISASTWGGSSGLYTNDTQFVETPSGNVKITCKFVVPEYAIPDKAVTVKGFPMYSVYGETFDTQLVVSPGGTATAQVMYK